MYFFRLSFDERKKKILFYSIPLETVKMFVENKS